MVGVGVVGVGVVGVVGVHALLEVGEEDPPAVEILEELHLDGARGVVIGRVGVVRDAHTSPCGSLRGERLAGGGLVQREGAEERAPARHARLLLRHGVREGGNDE